MGAGRAVIPLLRVGWTSGRATLDPAKSYGAFQFPIYDHLLQFGPTGQLVPDLATSVSQPSPATYVFQLRHGVKFWDGSELTSADVVNALSYERVPSKSPDNVAAYLRAVKSIAAKGRYTVVIVLKQANAAFKYGLAYGAGSIFERKFQLAHKATFGQPGTLTMATGPWIPVSFDPTSGIELNANPHWWGGKVNIQHISMKYFADETSEALAFRAGEIDVAFPFSAQAFATAAATKLITVQSTATIDIFGMNTTVAPWSDLHVRRAVAYALNRAALITAAGTPAAAATTLILPQQLRMLGSAARVKALLRSLPSYPYNLAAAKRELAQSAYPHGFTASLDTCQFGPLVPVSEAIAGQLKPIGIDLKINSSCQKFSTDLTNPKTPLVYTDFVNPIPDPSTWPTTFLGSKNTPPSGYNVANYTPPSVDTLLAAGLATSNPGKRLAIYGKLLKNLATDVPYLVLFTEDSSLALSSKFAWPTFNYLRYDRNFWPLDIKPK
jgi:peptide/nickel transport system substrate-binding protein